MANSVDHDEIALYKLSYLDLPWLQRYPFWSAEIMGLNNYMYFLYTTYPHEVFVTQYDMIIK